jgi:hypothetical protein
VVADPLTLLPGGKNAFELLQSGGAAGVVVVVARHRQGRRPARGRAKDPFHFFELDPEAEGRRVAAEDDVVVAAGLEFGGHHPGQGRGVEKMPPPAEAGVDPAGGALAEPVAQGQAQRPRRQVDVAEVCEAQGHSGWSAGEGRLEFWRLTRPGDRP